MFEADSAERALQTIESRQLEPDLVLSDVILPQMSGFELLRTLSCQGYRGKVLLMSGYVDESTLSERQRAVHVPVLRKPFSIRQLLEATGAALGSRYSGITELKPKREVSG